LWTGLDPTTEGDLRPVVVHIAAEAPHGGEATVTAVVDRRPQTAYRRSREGTMHVPDRRLPSGTIVVADHRVEASGPRTVAYCR
jgi:hypothetical protein